MTREEVCGVCQLWDVIEARCTSKMVLCILVFSHCHCLPFCSLLLNTYGTGTSWSYCLRMCSPYERSGKGIAPLSGFLWWMKKGWYHGWVCWLCCILFVSFSTLNFWLDDRKSIWPVRKPTPVTFKASFHRTGVGRKPRRNQLINFQLENSHYSRHG